MKEQHTAVPVALTIAGSDSSGGAGIQADLKAFSALGVYGASVITAVTAQNTREVRTIHSLPPAVIRSQIDCVFDDLTIAAVKTGMLGNYEMVEAVADALTVHQPKQLIIDPVMVSKTGDALLQQQALNTLRDNLLPLSTLLTPNLPETAVLLGQVEPETMDDMKDAALALHALGPKAVLVKGGHQQNSEFSIDLLYDGRDFTELPARRIKTENTHGTGCSLASAITAGLSKGMTLQEAVFAAKNYISAAIAAADRLDIGQGHGPVHHFYSLWGDS